MKGWVYIATLADADGVVKIGYSSKNPSLLVTERPDATTTPRKATAVYAALVENPSKVEAATHKELKSFNTNGKWFRVHPVRAMDTIKAHCQPLFEEGSLIDGTVSVQKDQAVVELKKDHHPKIKRESQKAKQVLLGMVPAIFETNKTASTKTPGGTNKLTLATPIQSPMIGNMRK